jgi:hypothetical protein
MEGSDAIIFFPKSKVNRGKIEYVTKNEGHGEAGIHYYYTTKKAPKNKAESMAKWYQEYSDSLGYTDIYYLICRLNLTTLRRAWAQ